MSYITRENAMYVVKTTATRVNATVRVGRRFSSAPSQRPHLARRPLDAHRADRIATQTYSFDDFEFFAETTCAR